MSEIIEGLIVSDLIDLVVNIVSGIANGLTALFG